MTSLKYFVNYMNDELLPLFEAKLDLDYKLVANYICDDDGNDSIEYHVFDKSDVRIELDDAPEKVISIIDEILNLFEGVDLEKFEERRRERDRKN